MYIEPLQQQMAVCSADGAIRLTSLDKHYWNVVSIRGPGETKAHLPLAKKVHHACFDDVEDGTSALYRHARAADMADIFDFIRSLGSGPPAPPLMIHCQQGISRSAAVALAWIYSRLPVGDDRSSQAFDLLLQLRPQAKPNRLVLALALTQFMPNHEARRLTNWMLSEPRLARNHFSPSRVEEQNHQKTASRPVRDP